MALVQCEGQQNRPRAVTVVFRHIIGLYKFLRFYVFKIHFCRISYVFSNYVQRHPNLPFSPFKLRVRAMHSDDVCVIMTGSDSPTQRCSADVASLGPRALPSYSGYLPLGLYIRARAYTCAQSSKTEVQTSHTTSHTVCMFYGFVMWVMLIGLTACIASKLR